MTNIRNFVIIAHIDHGKSTLADRFLELTGTIAPQKLREQFLDQMDLERERGITIKMQPVRMVYHPHRGITQKSTQNGAESDNVESAQKNNDFFYKDLTYKIRGILFEVRKKLGLGHKEDVYHNAIEIEFRMARIPFESRKNITIQYEGKSIGTYQPDFIIENKVLVELKALPEIGRPQIEQVWSYLKGSEYKLALLVNFGSKDLDIKRIVYDVARKDSSALSALSLRNSAGASNQIEDEYILNLIDTPGHVDFSYEVSRSLAAVEGAILLVDGTQGIQAQTLAHLSIAKKQGLTIIGAINKIDLQIDGIEELASEIAALIGVSADKIFRVSARTGLGVKELLDEVVNFVPPPRGNKDAPLQALIFDSRHDPYKGVIAYVSMKGGRALRGKTLCLAVSKMPFDVMEVGYFKPEFRACDALFAGDIGYIATGIKDPGVVKVGDTIGGFDAANKRCLVEPLAGYLEPQPLLFAGFFPTDEENYEHLRDALAKLKLNDAALTYETERQVELGKGFRVGFLGTLHMEIVKERISREYNLEPLITIPSVRHKIRLRSGEFADAHTPQDLPPHENILEIQEPWVKGETILPQEYLGAVLSLIQSSRGKNTGIETLGQEKIILHFEAPLAELVVGFYDKLKSVSRGYASVAYRVEDWRAGDLVKLNILIAGEAENALSRIVPRQNAESTGRAMVVKLKEILPREVFPVSLQAAITGRVIARETIPALKKDVTGYLYGGDRTRKMKLWKKQKRGKKRLSQAGRVTVGPKVFFELLKIEK